VRRDDDHLDGDGGAQQVDHLLVGERGHRHLADLHQAAAGPQPRLPGVAVQLHLGHDALEVDVEAQLAQGVAAQRHLRGLAALGQQRQGDPGEGGEGVGEDGGEEEGGGVAVKSEVRSGVVGWKRQKG